jgi:hypothetical protein
VTWLKLSDDTADRAGRARLSDAAFRTHVEGLIWAMRRENGGLLDDRDIRQACETADPAAAIAELVAAGWWEAAGGGRVQIVENMLDQPEPEVIDARRKLGAERQRRHRRKLAGLDPGPDEVTPSRKPSRRDMTRDADRDATRDPGRVGSGLVGEPRSTESELEDAHARGDPAWPEVTSPADSGDGDQAGCIAGDCPRPARRACKTCWDHRDQEPAR